MLALTVGMLSYVDSVRLVGEKTQISQLARKYILKMETEGRLTDADRTHFAKSWSHWESPEWIWEDPLWKRQDMGKQLCLLYAEG